MCRIIIDEKLKEELRKRRVVIFAGAGINGGLGLPTWIDFASNIIDYLYENKPKRSKERRYYQNIKNGLEENKNALEALDKIKREDVEKTKEYVANAFGIKSDIGCKTHKRLLSISRRIITTNFDNAFERAYESTHNGHLPHVVVGTRKNDEYTLTDLSSRIHNGKSFIFKIHGSREQPDSCIITRKAYKDFYEGANKARSILEELCRNYTILFIGWSFDDDFVKRLFVSQCGGECEKHYIVTTQPDRYSKNEDFRFLKPITVQNYNEETMNALYSALEKCVNKGIPERLRSWDVFSNLTNDSIVKLSKGDVRKFQKNDCLSSEGEKPDCFYVILEGTVSAKDKNENIVINKKQSEIIGEMSCILNVKRTNNLICTSKTVKVLSITKDMIDTLANDEREKLWKNISVSYFKRLAEDDVTDRSWEKIVKSITTSMKNNNHLDDKELNNYLLQYITELSV